MTNIYISDEKGFSFGLSLMNAVRNLEGNVDFERIFSNYGTFISNVFDQEELTRT